MNKQSTLPTFGEIVPGEGGRLGAIMRGALVHGVRLPDYAIIVPEIRAVKLPWGEYGVAVPGAVSLTDGLANTMAMMKAGCRTALQIGEFMKSSEHQDLYLPARAEMWALHANVTELFNEGEYWTSSVQFGGGYAYAHDFRDGDSDLQTLGCLHWVCAVRRITLRHS